MYQIRENPKLLIATIKFVSLQTFLDFCAPQLRPECRLLYPLHQFIGFAAVKIASTLLRKCRKGESDDEPCNLSQRQPDSIMHPQIPQQFIKPNRREILRLHSSCVIKRQTNASTV